jgi:predicted transcriptional regulator
MSRLKKQTRLARPAAKISVTVDPAVLRDVKAAARRSGSTLSAHISQALARDVRRRRLAELVAEHEAGAGVIGDAELAKARSAWQA